MDKKKLVRITTVPISLEKLLEGQLSFMSNHFDVTAISSEDKRLNLYGDKEGVETHYLELTRKITPLKDLIAVFKLVKYLRKEKPQIVHSHTPKAGIVGMLSAYIARVPIRLHTVAGLPLMEAGGVKRKVLNIVEKLTYTCATKVYPNSQGLKDFIVEEKLTLTEKIKIIGNGSSNGIDTTYFDPTRYSVNDTSVLKESLNISSEDFIFIFVGRLVGDKGINELVKAFVSISHSYDTVSLLLVGPLETELDPLDSITLKHINEHPKIIATGYQTDVRPYFAASNALVFPSYREGFPNVVLQAAAMELPCVVSNINGCNEIIENGTNGLIVPVKQHLPLEKAMKEMFNDQKLFAVLKKNTRTRIVQNYDRKEIWNEILKEYESLIDATN
ncbi:glycosyltransferase family 4 protein [uncultured Dokdonia sp.]|mgnify:CR=1 FL=1|uniref:glycosyltransferase family 4 protein n=1 Tax=uncultured Dokdonia sp. TaxID=575653 RepID=UPI0030EB8640|tara:strand:+ start:37995 stop:39158 length:1164 start_codon:yes stop_codon:yes gene_type:complete